MKDSKTVRDEHQSFVDAWKKIQEDNSSTPVAEGSKSLKDMTKTPKKGYKTEKVLVRKSGAFTTLAEKYNMSPKQFGRYVEANQHLFDIPTRKKATLANKFQGFKETKEWDEFFGDLELVESKAPYIVHEADRKGNTPAWQGYVEGKINEVTGEPLYVAGDDIQEKQGIFKSNVLNKKYPNQPQMTQKGKRILPKLNDPIINGKNYNKTFGIGSDSQKALDYLNNSTEVEGNDLQEITTKDTKSGTKFKVRVKDKKTGSSYIRFATRDKISQLRSDPKIASVEMTDEGQTPEERGEKKAQAAGGGDQKKAKKDYDGDGKVETGSQEYLGSRDKAIKKAMKKRSVTTEGSDINEALPLAPLAVAAGMTGASVLGGKLFYDSIKPDKKTPKKVQPKLKKEDSDINEAVPQTELVVPTPKKIKKPTGMASIKKNGVTSIKASYDVLPSNWRQDLKEIMGEVEKSEEKKKEKGKKAKNKIAINPDTDDEKNKYEEVNAKKLAENLGADLQSLKIEDADGNVAYEVVDLVKPDPIKEQNFLQTAIDKVKNIGGAMVNKYRENEAAKKKFRDENPGGTLTKKSYMKRVNDGTSSKIGMP